MNPAMRPLAIGDRVKILLNGPFWRSTGWHEGTIRRVDPYSDHRSFYWVELDLEVESAQGGRTNMISAFNPKHIQRLVNGNGSDTP